LLSRTTKLGYDLKLTDRARDFIAEKGIDKQYGARPLKRAIQKYVEDPLAEEIVNTNLEEEDEILMDLDESGEKLSVKINKKERSTENE
jgi:ATP-dependent Clp protease ATP-binding subunit ClpC